MAERIEPVGAPVAYETPDAAAMPAGRRDYGRIPFDGLPNTRDLGGLTGADGSSRQPASVGRAHFWHG